VETKRTAVCALCRTQYPCVNCGAPHGHHVREKCLFERTKFDLSPVDRMHVREEERTCKRCHRTRRAHCDKYFRCSRRYRDYRYWIEKAHIWEERPGDRVALQEYEKTVWHLDPLDGDNPQP